VIVGAQPVRIARIGDRQTAARIRLTREHVGDRLSALVAGIQAEHDRLRRVRDAADQPWTSLDQHENHGLAGRRDFTGEPELRVGQLEIVDVAGRLGIRHLAEAEDDGVGLRCGVSRGREINLFRIVRSGT